MPETTPSAGREMYGTMPKWRPSAACTQIEKQIIMSIVVRRVFCEWTHFSDGSRTMMSVSGAIGIRVDTLLSSAYSGERMRSDEHGPRVPTAESMVYEEPHETDTPRTFGQASVSILLPSSGPS